MSIHLTCALLGLLAGGVNSGPEANAAALAAKVESTARDIHSFHCNLLVTRTYTSAKTHHTTKVDETLDVTFERPNRFTITSKDSNEPESYSQISDGKNLFWVGSKNYSKTTIDKRGEGFDWYHDDLLLLLVTGSFDKALELPVKPTTTLLPDDTWNGQSYHVIDMALAGGYPIDYKIYVDDDNFVHRILHTESDEGHPFIEDFTVVGFEKNPVVNPSKFAFTPDANQKLVAEISLRQGDTPLIGVGKAAAPFALPTPAGNRLPLSEALAGKKALLLNFWFVHCPPCRAEHPKLERLYRELKDQGLDVLSIDDQDTPEAVANYWRGAGLTFRTVLSGPRCAIDPKTGYPDYRGPKLPDYASLDPYGVHSCPTNILLNSDGEVVFVSIGWDEAGLRNALEKLGIK